MSEPVIEFRPMDGNFQSMYACFNCKILGIYANGYNSKETASKCCMCTHCSESVVSLDPYRKTVCVSCEKILQNKRDAKRLAELETLSEIEDDGGPVFFRDVFYPDLQACIDYLHDELDDDELKTAVVHPCSISKASLPDLAYVIEEHISMQFSEGDDYRPFLKDKHLDLLEAVIDQLPRPDVWTPITNVRLVRSWLDQSVHDSSVESQQ